MYIQAEQNNLFSMGISKTLKMMSIKSFRKNDPFLQILITEIVALPKKRRYLHLEGIEKKTKNVCSQVDVAKEI